MVKAYIIKVDSEPAQQLIRNMVLLLAQLGGGIIDYEERNVREGKLVDPAEGGDATQEKGGGSKARKEYYAVLPEDATERMRVIASNLETLGNTTIKGLVYQDLVTATVEGRALTEPEIRKRRFAGKAGTSQREVGDLVRIGIVANRPIVNRLAD